MIDNRYNFWYNQRYGAEIDIDFLTRLKIYTKKLIKTNFLLVIDCVI